MVVNANEMLIKFPISEWMLKTIGLTRKLTSSANCICYQYNINTDGFGPYGFSTPKSEGLLSALFHNLLLLKPNNSGLDSCSKVGKQGLYIYGDKSLEMSNEVREYKSYLLKNKFLSKRGLPLQQSISKPLLLQVYNDDQIDEMVLNQIIRKECYFFLNYFFSPVAGQTLIFFDDDLWEKAEDYCRDHEIFIRKASSIDDLKTW